MDYLHAQTESLTVAQILIFFTNNSLKKIIYDYWARLDSTSISYDYCPKNNIFCHNRE